MDKQTSRKPSSVAVLGGLTALFVVPLVVSGIYSIGWDNEPDSEAVGLGSYFGWSALTFAAVLIVLALGAVESRHRAPAGSVVVAALALSFALLTGGWLLQAWVLSMSR